MSQLAGAYYMYMMQFVRFSVFRGRVVTLVYWSYGRHKCVGQLFGLELWKDSVHVQWTLLATPAYQCANDCFHTQGEAVLRDLPSLLVKES